ncbi:hypothetical protein TNIN_91871 [Trichonephila inaurata madagascariensis]|uniref:Uncharacterized protein n=1 Tax=Trichonephila inaurata madagascariensis TaxID=2747483 RepID=A0A8X6WWQ2_9ARAC|nr:hypothetical protein TNIN_91871 [Trichonephila inaurata madagascariensis]
MRLQPDHGHQEMLDGLPRNSARPSGPLILDPPNFKWGTTQVEKVSVLPLLLVRYCFPTLELALWCFNLHNKASIRVEDVRDIRHTPIPFTEQRGV